MRKVFLSVITLFLLLTACSPQAQATELPQAGGMQPTPTHSSVDLTPAQRAAIAALSKNLGLSPDKIKVISTEAVDWPDSCLGVSVQGIMCSQEVTSGFRVVLEAEGKQVEYHTNQDGSVVVPATVALTWSRNGGVAGFCDNLTIYLSGEVQSSNCKAGNVTVKSVSDLLSPAEIATMNDWISKYGDVSIDASDPAGVADAMSVKLSMHGTGTQQLMDKASQQILLQFIQNLNQKMVNP